jgi:hypothetical protein
MKADVVLSLEKGEGKSGYVPVEYIDLTVLLKDLRIVPIPSLQFLVKLF